MQKFEIPTQNNTRSHFCFFCRQRFLLADLLFISAVTFSGFVADSRTLVERVRLEPKNFTFNYGHLMAVEALTQAVSNLMLEFGNDDAKAPMSRPFGVTLLFAGCDQKGPQLYDACSCSGYI